jgi:pimeloyl-ACP methyl ester carboxylesterase
MKLKHLLFLAVLMMTGKAFALNPSREYKVNPEKYGMQYSKEMIPTKDGLKLCGWFFELPKKTTNWIIISASGDGNMADNLEICSQFMSAGWNVCMYDYRGYGESDNFTIDPQTYIYPQFLTDLNSVIDFLRKSRAITKIDLYGKNIGAGLSLGVGCNRPETRKIIADGPWTGLELMKKKFKDVQQKDVIIPFGFDKTYEPIYACDKLKSNLRGVMLIVSPKDPMLNAEDMKLLRCSTTAYIVPTSPGNDQNFETDKNMYFDKINKFLTN